MATLDDRPDRALDRLREELRLLRLANNRLDQRLAAAAKPRSTLLGIRVPDPIGFVRKVIAWLTRSRT